MDEKKYLPDPWDELDEVESEKQHTPEPWEFHGPILDTSSIYDLQAGNKQIARITAYEFYNCSIDEANANAYRIVECVNACAGIPFPTKFIPAMRKEMQDIRAAIGADENESTLDEIERFKIRFGGATTEIKKPRPISDALHKLTEGIQSFINKHK